MYVISVIHYKIHTYEREIKMDRFRQNMIINKLRKIGCNLEFTHKPHSFLLSIQKDANKHSVSLRVY